jgi:hypothetical protein
MNLRKLLILGVIGGLLLGSGIAPGASADSTPVPTPDAIGATFKTYLPIMLHTSLLPPIPTNLPPTFGVELINAVDSTLMNNLSGSGATWTRHTVLEWASIEPVRTNPPTYLWNKVNNGKESSLRAASDRGVDVIATVKFTPSWAQKYPGVSCGPVHPNNLDEFAQFMAAAVARYSVPPYNIKFWEIGNEPDVDISIDPPDSVFGCWGDQSKPATFGGDYYAEMLKVVYPAIKAADPSAQVVIGGLLLDCDPNNPPPNKSCIDANFLEGILMNDGADYFDYVAFHAYANYVPTPSLTNPSIVDENPPSPWAHLGGTVVGKVTFLRNVLAKYGVSKPLILDEGGLICHTSFQLLCNPPSAKFYQDQADYLVKMYVRNISLDIVATIWFTLEGPGWHYGGLYYDTITTPKPAYYALSYLTRELNGAAYVGQVNQYPGVWGYEFSTATKRIWVLGVSGLNGYTITLPAGWQAVYDKYGAAVTPNNNQVYVKSPLYVEFAP